MSDVKVLKKEHEDIKSQLKNLVLEQCDDYLDTDQITFALKQSDHTKRWL